MTFTDLGSAEWAQRLGTRVVAVLDSIPGSRDSQDERYSDFRFLEGSPPEWLLVPTWLHQAWTDAASERLSDDQLDEVLWGQYALFLCIRIQDDLLDGQQRDLRLIYAADRFLLQSLETFQRLTNLNASFWDVYRHCMRETVDAILEVGCLERLAGGFTDRDLVLHARVSAIFKVATVAVCHLHGRHAEMSWISRVQDQLAIISQVADDLRDVVDDVEKGRFTWVANQLLGVTAGGSIPPDQVRARLGQGFLRSDGDHRIIDRLRQATEELVAAVPESAPEPFLHLVGEIRTKPDELEHRLHEARVRMLFGETLGWKV